VQGKTEFFEFIIVNAIKSTKNIIKAVREDMPRLSRIFFRSKELNIYFRVFPEVLAFNIYCAINSFRGKLKLSDEHTRELHEELYKGFAGIDLEKAPVGKSSGTGKEFSKINPRVMTSLARRAGQSRETNELVYAYLCGDKTISEVDDSLLSVIGGMVGVKEISDYINANYIVSFCRLLRALGGIKNGRLVLMDYTKAATIWTLHVNYAAALVIDLGKILDDIYQE
jgi:hypothetical protein